MILRHIPLLAYWILTHGRPERKQYHVLSTDSKAGRRSGSGVKKMEGGRREDQRRRRNNVYNLDVYITWKCTRFRGQELSLLSPSQPSRPRIKETRSFLFCRSLFDIDFKGILIRLIRSTSSNTITTMLSALTAALALAGAASALPAARDTTSVQFGRWMT
jgi:hypothetical protein